MRTMRVRLANVGLIETLVDEETHARHSHNAWRIFGSGYVGRKVYSHFAEGKSHYKIVYLHRLVAGVDDDERVVDHINRNTLDNRAENLRLCTRSQNGYNRTAQLTKFGLPTTSSMKGVRRAHVSTRAKTNPWVAEIRVSGKTIALGYFPSEEEAAAAYDEAARSLHGEFACVNGVFDA